MVLTTIATRWGAGEITLEQAIREAGQLNYPVRREDAEGHWFEGNQDNTISAVQALVGTELTFEQFAEFSEAFSTL